MHSRLAPNVCCCCEIYGELQLDNVKRNTILYENNRKINYFYYKFRDYKICLWGARGVGALVI